MAASFVPSLTAAEPEPLRFDEEYYSTQKKIRITDGIGKGRSKEIALQNAIVDARKKALVRVTSTFRHVLSESKDGVFVKKDVVQEVHAKIIEKEDIISIDYDHDMNFSPYYVAIVDCEITVSFLDLDFFAQEIMKTAEAACIRSIVLSGWGQVFNRAYFSGVSMGLITYGSIGYGYYREQQIDEAREAYKAATDSTTAERRYKEMRDHRETARTMYVIGALTWAYSVWDAFEDRERADEVLDKVHKLYFPQFPYKRNKSFVQEFIMKNTRPEW